MYRSFALARVRAALQNRAKTFRSPSILYVSRRFVRTVYVIQYYRLLRPCCFVVVGSKQQHADRSIVIIVPAPISI